MNCPPIGATLFAINQKTVKTLPYVAYKPQLDRFVFIFSQNVYINLQKQSVKKKVGVNDHLRGPRAQCMTWHNVAT